MNIVIAVAEEQTGRSDVQDALRCAQAVAEALRAKRYGAAVVRIDRELLSAPDRLRAALTAGCPDCIFNLFEGFSDNAAAEADFAAVLETLSTPFTGNGSQTLRLCLDKQAAKSLLAAAGLPVPAGVCLRPGDPIPDDVPAFPVFIKPCCEDASVGIDERSLACDAGSLGTAVREKLAAFPSGIVIETFLGGIEYNVGCIGDPPYDIVGVSAMDYGSRPDMPSYMTYGAKWNPDAKEYHVLMPRPDAVQDACLRQRIESLAAAAGRTLGCRGYFRVDLREHCGEVYVMDVNPNPDINTDSGFMRQAYARGMRYDEMLDKIIKTAIKIFGNRYAEAKNQTLS